MKKQKTENESVLTTRGKENSLRGTVIRHSVKHEQDSPKKSPSTGKLPANMTHG